MKNKDYNILYKYPTRERPQQFLENLTALCRKINDRGNSFIQVALDDTDPKNYSAYLDATIDTCMEYGIAWAVKRQNNTSKVEAINSELFFYEFDICVLMSDDMVCQVIGFDDIIRQHMRGEFPDTDGALWFHDGDKNTKDKLCTMVIAGRKYLERFGYIYHPSYKSLFPDDEFTRVGLDLKKLYRSGIILFRHEHYMNNRLLKPDNLMKRNQSFYGVDRANFIKRLNSNFPK